MKSNGRSRRGVLVRTLVAGDVVKFEEHIGIFRREVNKEYSLVAIPEGNIRGIDQWLITFTKSNEIELAKPEDASYAELTEQLRTWPCPVH